MARVPDSARSLEQLERDVWPPAPEDATSLVQRCHALRKVPVSQLGGGDLRVMLNQGIGTKYLVPLALELLANDAMVEGDYYPGDLLNAAVGVQPSYWPAHQSEYEQLRSIAANTRRWLTSREDSRRQHRQLLKALDGFLDSDA